MGNFFLSIIFSLISIFSFAQNSDTVKVERNEHLFSPGVRIGYGYSNIITSDQTPSRFTYKPSPQFGVSMQVKILKPLYIQTEVLYSYSGNTLIKIDKNGNKSRDSTYNRHCVQLPVQLKLKVGKTIRGYYMIGVAPSLLLGSNMKYKIDSTHVSMNYKYYWGGIGY